MKSGEGLSSTPFFPGKQDLLFYSTSKYFILRLTREWLKVRDHKKAIRDFSVQPLFFPSLKICLFLFYFRTRFAELAQDSNQLAEHSMKTIPKGLQGLTLHPGKCQKPWNNGHEQLQWISATSTFLCRWRESEKGVTITVTLLMAQMSWNPNFSLKGANFTEILIGKDCDATEQKLTHRMHNSSHLQRFLLLVP